ncbi:MAG: FecR family protein [Marinifilaceae bacterium]
MSDKEKIPTHSFNETERLIKAYYAKHNTNVNTNYIDTLKRAEKRKRNRFLRVAISSAACILVTITLSLIMTIEQNVHTQSNEDIIIELASGEIITINHSTNNINNEITANDSNVNIKRESIKHTQPNSKEKSTKYNTVKTPYATTYQICLSDGTKVWLNANSSIKYPTSFVSRERIVHLSGEAYFEVQADTAHPFIVKTSNIDVTATGTCFNVLNTDYNVEAVLVTGSINVKDHKENTHILLPGQQYIHNNGTPTINTIDTDTYTAWKNNKFHFQQTNLEHITNQLKLWYGIDVIYINNCARKLHFSLFADRSKSISEIMTLLTATERLNYSINNNTLYIY